MTVGVLMTPHTRLQTQPEPQSRKEYAWPSAFRPVFIKFHFRSDSDLTSQLVTTRAELAALQERYDALHADRDRLAQTLSESMKKYKRFKRWVVSTKGKVPPKHTKRDEMRACSSTPAVQQQSVIKMLETPVTPMSLCPVSVQYTFC